jgi:flagellum-specific ATP synthase
VGEPPATKGYTPSVFANLALLLERAGALEGEGSTGGRVGGGSITGLYTILVEGDDLTEPVSDAARGILDGHVILTRKLANRAHYPAVDVLDSISRVADDVTDKEHQEARRKILRLMAIYRDVEDLVNIGAYAKGSNPEADVAIELQPQIMAMLRQGREESTPFPAAREMLLKVAAMSEMKKAVPAKGKKAAA